MPPCMTSMATLTSPVSSANGFREPEQAASVGDPEVGIEGEGAPPGARCRPPPRRSAPARRPPMNSAQSHTERQIGLSILLRNLKPTGRRMSAHRTSSMAR